MTVNNSTEVYYNYLHLTHNITNTVYNIYIICYESTSSIILYAHVRVYIKVCQVIVE